MAREVVIKLELSPASLERLEASEWLGQRRTEGQREELRSVYFDTASRALRGEGVALRVRHVGSKRMQGVESARLTGDLVPEESEQEVEGDAPDVERARGTALDALPTEGLQAELEPVFETHVERTVFPLRREGVEREIEVAVERGEIRAGSRSEAISEIELSSSSLEELVGVAQVLGEHFDLRYSVRSRAERAYALVDGRSAEPARAERVTLERGASVADGLKLIGLSCLRHFASNQAALARGESEALHQSRVALRRLRAALSLFREVLEDDESRRIKGGLRWLGSQLGPARDYEVFIEDTLLPLQRAGQHSRELHDLELTVRRRRDESLDAAQRVAAGGHARQVLLQAALWLLGGDWLAAPHAQSQLRSRLKTMARKTLTKRARKLDARLTRFERLDAHQRHQLRIAVKKLHYGTEFFAPLFPKRKGRRERYLTLLKELQGQLGALNDIHTHEAMAGELVHTHRVGEDEPQPRAAFAMGLVRGIEQAHARKLAAAAQKTCKKLARARPFWT
jgi:triphosphatase